MQIKYLFITIFLFLFFSSRTLFANFLEYAGFQAGSISRGNALTAFPYDFTSAFFNPALIPFFERVNVGTGFQMFIPNFYIKRDKVLCVEGASVCFEKYGKGYTPYRSFLPEVEKGFTVGMIFPYTLLNSIKSGIGIAFYFPEHYFVRARSINIEYPHFPVFEYDFNRLGFVVSTGFMPARFLSVGVGVQILTDVYGKQVVNFDTLNEIADSQTIKVESHPKLAAIIGFTLSPVDDFTIGFSYRQRLFLKYHLPSVMSFENMVDFDMTYTLISAYTPDRFNLAVTKNFDIAKLFFKLSLSLWKFMPPPSPPTYIDVTGDIIENTGFHDTLDLDSKEFFKENDLRNTVSIHAGASFDVSRYFTLNCGFGYIPFFIKNESGVFNYLDNTIVYFSYGITVKTFSKKVADFNFDIAGTTGFLVKRVIKKDPSDMTGGYSHGGLYQIFGVSINAYY